MRKDGDRLALRSEQQRDPAVIDQIARRAFRLLLDAVHSVRLADGSDLLRRAGEADEARVEGRDELLSTAGVSRSGSVVMKIGWTLRASSGSLASSRFIASPICCMSTGQTSGQNV
jgi:hypothetical protein